MNTIDKFKIPHSFQAAAHMTYYYQEYSYPFSIIYPFFSQLFASPLN